MTIEDLRRIYRDSILQIAAHPEVPWTQIIGMRNILVHHYFDVDVDVIWSAVERDLPHLEAALELILASLPPAP